jgi:hypothetical protein
VSGVLGVGEGPRTELLGEVAGQVEEATADDEDQAGPADPGQPGQECPQRGWSDLRRSIDHVSEYS